MQRPNLSPPILFFSDVHLGGFSEPENQRIEAELIQLIDYCRQNSIRMAILGDLFDYWMEYPGHTPRLGRRLLEHFEEYNRQLGPTLYITGNHDNWTRGHLTDRGFFVENESFSLSLNSQNILLLHGDGLKDPTFDLPRPPIHRLLRAPAFVRLYQRILPPQTGLNLMKYFSRFNRWADHQTADGSKLNHWARQQLARSETNLIICGHDHIPRQKHFTFGSYINLGTFYKDRTMAYYNNSEITIVSWTPESRTLQPFDPITISE